MRRVALISNNVLNNILPALFSTYSDGKKLFSNHIVRIEWTFNCISRSNCGVPIYCCIYGNNDELSLW